MSAEAVDEKIAVVKPFAVLSVEPTTTTKSTVIDQELNRHGMGRYQWLIWATCGIGFFVDIMWMNGLALVWSSLQHEFGISDKDAGTFFFSFALGSAVGGFTWGILVDVIGRRMAFLGTSLIAGVSGMCLGAQSSYPALLAFTALTGVGAGGNVPIDATIASEYLPKNRFYLLTALSIFQPLGFITSSLLGFAFILNYSCSTEVTSCHLTGGAEPCCSRAENMGWRYLLFTLGSISLAVFILRCLLFPFYESPKFLLAKGRDGAAVEVVRKITAFNGRRCDLTVESLREQSSDSLVTEHTGVSNWFVSEGRRLRQLFGSWRMTRVTILVWIVWIFNNWGVRIALTFLPTILQRKNGEIHVGLRQTYVDYLIIFTPGLVAVALAILMVRAPTIGRKWTLVMSSALAGASLFLFSVVDTEASNIGFNLLEYFSQSIFNATLFGWTPEAFPSAVRGTASGLASLLSGMAGICAPLIGGQLFDGPNGSNAVLYLAGSGVFVCTIALLLLPASDMLAPR